MNFSAIVDASDPMGAAADVEASNLYARILPVRPRPVCVRVGRVCE